MYYTYVLKSNRDEKLYIGFTCDLKNRIKQHKQGKVIATKKRLPVELIYYEACNNKEKAIKREKIQKLGLVENI